MKKHIIILATCFLIIGYLWGAVFVLVSIKVLSESTDSMNSMLADKASIYHSYAGYFARYGVSLPKSLAWIIASITFGHGLLRHREWAR